jgi:hypothetical protein
MNKFNLCDIDILNAALAENLTQTLITIVSAQEKLQELEKYKHLIHNALSPAEKKEKNIPKIKALLAGIQIGKQMILDKAKNIYSFENIDKLASNLTLDYKNSVENLISSSSTNQKKPSMHTDLLSSQFDKNNNNNKISSYLNIVSTNNHQQSHHQQQDGAKLNPATYNPFDSNLKCISAYIGTNNENKKTSIVPKNITNEFAEFDICYPPTKIDIFYPRAKINICSDTPQIDLNLPDPLIEYKSYCTNIKHAENMKKNTDNTDSATIRNSFIDSKSKYSTNKPIIHLDTIRTESFNLNKLKKITEDNTKKIDDPNDSVKYSSILRHASSIVEMKMSKNDTKTSSESHSSANSSKLNKNHELETENFIKTMINDNCAPLLQHLLQKYIIIDNSYKNGEIDSNTKIREYNEWLKKNHSVDENEAMRIQQYIETWYINCMLEKLNLKNK